ncbi:hypothetical protein HYH03_017517 [Edaphochlamys debaryana]|uniref:SnoaL-like domain-containing protein n=1 Tax=Edaphochlamys debaryana TaxID=47281 RepID=A0A836BP29_9CHLO|nr:hypothetical protein HYH03_017517 [Edaphochlamys debaryana]|eukprot:KAG2483640.1 hypothetical protein HYH03_017517 [Edaphochlamys debaryana]
MLSAAAPRLRCGSAAGRSRCSAPTAVGGGGGGGRAPVRALARAAPRPGARAGRSGRAVRVVAFRDAHRAELLLSSAVELLGFWMLGRAEGPTPRVMSGLGPLLAPDVVGELHGLISHTTERGAEGLARLLSPEHRPCGLTLQHWHTRVCAVDDDDDTVFCLMEMRAEDDQGRPRSCYQVIKTEWMLDDVSRAATRLLERGQWDSAGDGLTPVLLLGAGPEGEEALEGEQAPHRPPRVRSTRAGGEVVGSDLPVDHISVQSQVARFTRGLGAEQLKASSRTWCRARCSGADARALMDPLVAPEFRLWDAYGLLPLLCAVGGPHEGGTRVAGSMAAMAGHRGPGCVAGREAVYGILEAAKAEYDIDVTPIDVAASYTHNVVFTHWKCSMRPKHAGAGPGQGAAVDGSGRPAVIEQQAIEIDIFDTDGRLTDVWMFRDALDWEKHMVMARQRQALADAAQGQGGQGGQGGQ